MIASEYKYTALVISPQKSCEPVAQKSLTGFLKVGFKPPVPEAQITSEGKHTTPAITSSNMGFRPLSNASYNAPKPLIFLGF